MKTDSKKQRAKLRRKFKILFQRYENYMFQDLGTGECSNQQFNAKQKLDAFVHDLIDKANSRAALTIEAR